MAALLPAELQPGLSVFLTEHLLRREADVLTNARLIDNGTLGIDRDGFFLLLRRDEARMWLSVPLFSHDGPDRFALDQTLKTGPGSGWKSRASYYHRFHFWRLPAAAIVLASQGEKCAVGNRNRYASMRRDVLDLIAAQEGDSDMPFRALPLP